MARKDIVDAIIDAAADLSADYTSPVTLVKYLDNISYQIDVTANSSQGTFAVQGSNDYSPGGPGMENQANAGHWIDLVLSGGTPTVAGSDTDILIDLNQLPYKAIRLNYTSSVAGSGVAVIRLFAKQLG